MNTETHESYPTKRTVSISIDPNVWLAGQEFVRLYNQENGLNFKDKLTMSQLVEDLVASNTTI